MINSCNGDTYKEIGASYVTARGLHEGQYQIWCPEFCIDNHKQNSWPYTEL